MIRLARAPANRRWRSLMKQWMMIAAAIAGFALQPAASAVAADYPMRPITLIVPQAPGGGNDVIARILAETMSRTLGQHIIVENRPGAGGTIGTRQLAKVRRTGTRWSWAAAE